MATRSDRLRTPQAAEVLGITDRTLERMRERGDGPPYTRLSRRLIVYDADELRAWLASRRVDPEREARAS